MERPILMRRTIILAAILAIAFPSLSHATKYAGEFLYVGAGARALALGGAYVAMAGDATTAYWNPAGLYSLQGQEAATAKARILLKNHRSFLQELSRKTTDRP